MSKELSVFQNYREGEKIPNVSVEDTTLKNEENNKNSPSALEIVLNGLNEYYHFISYERQLYVYDEDLGYWKLIPASNSSYELRKLIPNELRRFALKINFSILYEWLLVDAEQKDKTFFQERFNWINFRDRAYNWKSDKAKKERKSLNFRYALNVDYSDTQVASSNAFKEFVDGLFSEPKTKKEFYKFLALCFGNIRTLKYVFFLYGVSDTGKTTVLNLIKHILGDDNCASLSFGQFQNEFAVATLNGKRANLSGEVSAVSNKKLDIIKSISGNDSVTASYKCKDHFQFENLCLPIFACNCLPVITDYLEAQSFLSRVIIFPFSNPVPREKWDKNLLQNLIKDLPGVFMCVQKGFKLLEDDGFKINESDEMLAAKLSYMGSCESFSLFCDKYIIKSNDSKISSAQIQECYSAFCIQRDYLELAPNQWAQVLKRNTSCQMSTMVLNGKRCRAYKGIKLSDKVEDLLAKEKVYDNAEKQSSSYSFLPSNTNLEE